jgi:hypothetical protein
LIKPLADVRSLPKLGAFKHDHFTPLYTHTDEGSIPFTRSIDIKGFRSSAVNSSFSFCALVLQSRLHGAAKGLPCGLWERAEQRERFGSWPRRISVEPADSGIGAVRRVIF